MSHMVGFVDIIISSAIGLVAIVVAIVSLLEKRKMTKLLETIIKTLPYTTGRKRTKATLNKKFQPRQGQIMLSE